MKSLEETIEEFDNLMQAGLDDVAVGDLETEYFSDAAYVIKDLPKELKDKLCNKYEINPMDFAS
jgi:hypothetical protein